MKKSAWIVMMIICCVTIGLSNCGCNVFTGLISACVGYTVGNIGYWWDRKLNRVLKDL